MADRPIIFSAPMVRALLDGRKTQTRRVLKPQPDEPKWDGTSTVPGEYPIDGWRWKSLPYAPGDRLWVREACSYPQYWIDHPNEAYIGHVFYEASKDAPAPSPWLRAPDPDHCRKRPSIHMPRWASRLTLTVTDVRVQRVQEISEADAVAEGVTRCTWAEEMAGDGRIEWHVPFETPGEYPGITNAHPSPRGAFWELWNSLHGPEAWAVNPWVVALTFTVHRCNIDDMEAANG